MMTNNELKILAEQVGTNIKIKKLKVNADTLEQQVKALEQMLNN